MPSSVAVTPVGAAGAVVSGAAGVVTLTVALAPEVLGVGAVSTATTEKV